MPGLLRAKTLGQMQSCCTAHLVTVEEEGHGHQSTWRQRPGHEPQDPSLHQLAPGRRKSYGLKHTRQRPQQGDPLVLRQLSGTRLPIYQCQRVARRPLATKLASRRPRTGECAFLRGPLAEGGPVPAAGAPQPKTTTGHAAAARSGGLPGTPAQRCACGQLGQAAAQQLAAGQGARIPQRAGKGLELAGRRRA